MTTDGQHPSASSSLVETEVDPMIGQVIDKRYRLTRKLGEGGMGEVYAADHLRIARSVAIKLLRAEVLTNAEAVARFEQEAMTASSIGHENIIRIEDSGKLEDGRIYLAMELLAGLPFNDLIDDQVIAPARLLHILIQTCHGLAAAHAKGIVHRDMKPENIYITTNPDGSDLPKLLDFGIAKVSQAEGENHLTRTGTIFGTPFYMAPEQALGESVDHRVDIYAMGVIMYEVFCGVVPFGGESFMGILTQHITSEPTPPSVMARQQGRGLPSGVEEVILRAMKKVPGERFQSMDELLEALVPLYRGLAGAGASSYMEAHTPAPAQAYPSASYPSASYPPASYPQQGVRAGVTGQEYPQQPGASASFVAAGPSAGMPIATEVAGVGGYAPTPGAAESFPMMPAQKSKKGLVLALALLLIGGSIAAFFILQGEAEPGSVSDESKMTASKTSAKASGVKSIAAAKSVEKVERSPLDAGSKTIDKSAVQAMEPDASAKTRVVLSPPAALLAMVLVDSRPSHATVFVDGEKKGRTPLVLHVDPTSPAIAVFRRKGYRDLSLTIDGSVEKVAPLLVQRGRGAHHSKGERTKGKIISDTRDVRAPPHKADPPKVDPCKKNPNLPWCVLE